MPYCVERVRISGDITQCERCGISWDTGDPFPPDCPFMIVPEAKKPAVGATMALCIIFVLSIVISVIAYYGFKWWGL